MTMNKALAAAGGFLSASFLAVSSALADPGAGNGGHMMNWSGDHMMGWGGWIIGPVMMLGALAILIAIVVFIVRLATNRGEDARPKDDSMQILRQRFAKGEISEAQFTQMKRNLEHEG